MFYGPKYDWKYNVSFKRVPCATQNENPDWEVFPSYSGKATKCPK